MKERGILFSAPMVLAILAGRKTVTRRLAGTVDPPMFPHRFGVPGDRLWVRETWRQAVPCDGLPLVPGEPVVYRADALLADVFDEVAGQWRPSIFMPRWASRILLEVIDVRHERLHDIRTADVFAEGVIANQADYAAGRQPVSVLDGKTHPNARTAWAHGWDTINGKRAPWRSNPVVWRVAFSVLS